MSQYSRRERDQLAAVAVDLRAQSWSYGQIARELGINPDTAARWVKDELARRSEHREGTSGNAREKAIAGYEALIREGWKRLKKLDDRSHNVPGCLNSIMHAQARIDKLTGAEASVKYLLETPDQELEIYWEDGFTDGTIPEDLDYGQ